MESTLERVERLIEGREHDETSVLEYGIALYEKTALQQETLREINRFIDLVKGSQPSQPSLDAQKIRIEDKLKQMHSSGAGGHKNPEWAIASMEGIWAFARGDTHA